MVRQAQVVVTAEVQILFAVDAGGWALWGFNDLACAIEVFALALSKVLA